jgi:hypothetical protein
MVDEGLALAYTPESGFFTVGDQSDLPEHEWLTWWRDFADEPHTEPVDRASRLIRLLLG